MIRKIPGYYLTKVLEHQREKLLLNKNDKEKQEEHHHQPQQITQKDYGVFFFSLGCALLRGEKSFKHQWNDVFRRKFYSIINKVPANLSGITIILVDPRTGVNEVPVALQKTENYHWIQNVSIDNDENIKEWSAIENEVTITVISVKDIYSTQKHKDLLTDIVQLNNGSTMLCDHTGCSNLDNDELAELISEGKLYEYHPLSQTAEDGLLSAGVLFLDEKWFHNLNQNK